jgi:hypothetical protein
MSTLTPLLNLYYRLLKFVHLRSTLPCTCLTLISVHVQVAPLLKTTFNSTLPFDSDQSTQASSTTLVNQAHLPSNILQKALRITSPRRSLASSISLTSISLPGHQETRVETSSRGFRIIDSSIAISTDPLHVRNGNWEIPIGQDELRGQFLLLPANNMGNADSTPDTKMPKWRMKLRMALRRWGFDLCTSLIGVKLFPAVKTAACANDVLSALLFAFTSAVLEYPFAMCISRIRFLKFGD